MPYGQRSFSPRYMDGSIEPPAALTWGYMCAFSFYRPPAALTWEYMDAGTLATDSPLQILQLQNIDIKVLYGWTSLEVVAPSRTVFRTLKARRGNNDIYETILSVGILSLYCCLKFRQGEGPTTYETTFVCCIISLYCCLTFRQGGASTTYNTTVVLSSVVSYHCTTT